MNKSRLTNLLALVIIAAGYVSPVYSRQILTLGFFALSGALTNWIAVHMLFEKVPLLYGSGVIPAHFQEIKSWISDLILTQFFSDDNLEHYLNQGQTMFLESMDMDAAVSRLDYDGMYDRVKEEILSSKLGGMLALFGGESFLEKQRETFITKVKGYIKEEISRPGFIASLLEDSGIRAIPLIQEKVTEIVQGRLEELTPRMVKELVQEMIQKHLGWLVVWGGVFGGLIGLVMSFVPGF